MHAQIAPLPWSSSSVQSLTVMLLVLAYSHVGVMITALEGVSAALMAVDEPVKWQTPFPIILYPPHVPLPRQLTSSALVLLVMILVLLIMIVQTMERCVVVVGVVEHARGRSNPPGLVWLY